MWGCAPAGRGDAVSEWAVNSIRLQADTIDAESWFLQYSTVQSNPADPLPLASSVPSMPRVFS